MLLSAFLCDGCSLQHHFFSPSNVSQAVGVCFAVLFANNHTHTPHTTHTRSAGMGDKAGPSAQQHARGGTPLLLQSNTWQQSGPRQPAERVGARGGGNGAGSGAGSGGGARGGARGTHAPTTVDLRSLAGDVHSRHCRNLHHVHTQAMVSKVRGADERVAAMDHAIASAGSSTTTTSVGAGFIDEYATLRIDNAMTLATLCLFRHADAEVKMAMQRLGPFMPHECSLRLMRAMGDVNMIAARRGGGGALFGALDASQGYVITATECFPQPSIAAASLPRCTTDAQKLARGLELGRTSEGAARAHAQLGQADKQARYLSALVGQLAPVVGLARRVAPAWGTRGGCGDAAELGQMLADAGYALAQQGKHDIAHVAVDLGVLLLRGGGCAVGRCRDHDASGRSMETHNE